MSGIAPNPLNAISKVYLDQVAEAKVEPPKEKLKTDRNMFNIPKDEQQAAKERLLAKSAAKRKAAMEALDPVGQEDADIDNDGDTDKSDKYLHKRRKAIGKAMKKRMKEEKELAEVTKMGVHAPHEVPDKNLKGLVKKAVKRIDADNDGDVDKDDPKETGMGEFVPSPDGKKKVRTKMAESLSNWRTDLAEIMDDDIDSKPIKEKKVNNKIKINPTLGEALEEIGATLIEMVEIDEFDFVVESVYDELLEEGYGEDDIEEAIEYALTEAKVTFGHDTPTKKDDVMKKAKGRLRYLRRKVGEKIGAAKKSAKYASAKAQVAAYNKGREVAQTAGYKTRKARQAVADAPGKAKKSVKGFIKKQAEKVAKRMSEENEIEEGIGMTMAKAVGNPPALSKRMKLKQALLNREIKKNAAENKKKSYSGAAASEKASKADKYRSPAAKTTAKEEVENVDEIYMVSPQTKKSQDNPKKKETWYDRDERKRKSQKEEVEQIEELTDLQRRRYLGRKPGESKERLKRSNERKDKKAALAAMEKQYRGMKAGIYSSYEPEGEQLDEMPFQVMGSPDGGKEKKIGKPVKSKKYADARAAELADTHKKTGGKYRSQYVEGVEQIDEKALSKAQQRFMGMVYATKKGKMAAPSPEVAKAAASMTGKEAKDFAKTKHKGLPEKKEVKEGATEMPMSPEELALQKKKTKIDLMISKRREQSLQKKKDI
jgi:hypothetical protein